MESLFAAGDLRLVMNENDRYHLALGRFVEAFATAETSLHVLLWAVSATTVGVSRAIFSGTRARTAIDFIRRIAEAERMPLGDALDDAFTRFSTINTVRDRILHYGSNSSDGIGAARLVSNRLTAHSPNSLFELPVSPKMLHEMTEDSMKLAAIFAGTAMSSAADQHPEVWRGFELRAQTPWLYKPVQQVPKSRKSRPKKE